MKTKYEVFPEHDHEKRKLICKYNSKCVVNKGRGCKCVTIPIDEYASFNCVFLALSSLDVKMKSLDQITRYNIYEHDGRYYICPNHIRKKFYQYLISIGKSIEYANRELYTFKNGKRKNTRLSTEVLPYVADFYESSILFTVPKDPSYPPIMYRAGKYPCTMTLKHDNDKHVNAGLFVPANLVDSEGKCDLFATPSDGKEINLRMGGGSVPLGISILAPITVIAWALVLL